MSRSALAGAFGGMAVAAVASAEDALDPSVVQQVLEQDSGVLDCYADELGRDPFAAGHASVAVTIGAGGEVSAAVVEAQCVSGDRFARCLERKLNGVAFGADAPQVTVTHDLLFNSGLVGHVVRGGADDVAMCATSSPPPPGGYFTVAWQVRAGEVVGAELIDASFEAEALFRCIHVRSESWGWDFSRWTDGDVRYAFRFVEADAEGPIVAEAQVLGPLDDDEARWWGELRSGLEMIRGNRVVESIPIALSGGERWGSNELFGEATGQTTARWHAHVRYHRWLSERSALHLLGGVRDDAFAGYHRRSQVLAGYSGWVVDSGSWAVAVDAGVEYAIEDYIRRVNEDWQGVLGLRLALPLTWRISDRIAVHETLALYQNVRDTDDRRAHNGVALRVRAAGPLSIEVGHSLAYDRDPVQTKEMLDHAASLGVVLHTGELQPVRWLDPLP